MNDRDSLDHRKLFREAMAHLSAAVNIITTDGPFGRCGMTASAVCSVTDSPPTMLVCVNQSSSSHAVFSGNGHVCINVLPGNHQELAKHFAGMTNLPMSARFDQHAWVAGRLGMPVLTDALASLEGRIVDKKDVGSHSVMFVEVGDVVVRSGGDGLIYFDRNFHRLAKGSNGVLA